MACPVRVQGSRSSRSSLAFSTHAGLSDSAIGQSSPRCRSGPRCRRCRRRLLRRMAARRLFVAGGVLDGGRGRAPGDAHGAGASPDGRVPTGMVHHISLLSVAPSSIRGEAEVRPFRFSASYGVVFASAIVGSIVVGGAAAPVHALPRSTGSRSAERSSPAAA